MDQAAVAIERVRLAKDMDDARVTAEAERLRGALLTSLSHDLKTPLASIVGAATSLCDYGENDSTPRAGWNSPRPSRRKALAWPASSATFSI